MAHLMNKAKAYLTEKFANMKKPGVQLSGFGIQKMSRDSALFIGNIDVRNPYSYPIPVCEVSDTLKSAGRDVLSGTLPDPGSLAGNTRTKLDVPMKVPYNSLMSVMKDVGRDWDIDYELFVEFTVDLPLVGNFTIPLSMKGEIKLPTLPDVF